MKHFIKYFLAGSGIMFGISAIVWTLVHPSDHWLWFSRACASCMCFGFSELIKDEA